MLLPQAQAGVTGGALFRSSLLSFSAQQRRLCIFTEGSNETMRKPITRRLSKSELIAELAHYVPGDGSPRKIAAAVLEGLGDIMGRSIAPRGTGEFVLPGVLKVVTRKRPAVKAGTLVRNPATGEMIQSPGRPASMQVKVRVLSKLKQAAQK
jgi:nucleoid DNA-binding protein